MTSTPLDTEAAPDVRDLDASAVLDAAVHERRTADAAEAQLLALAVHWAGLRPRPPPALRPLHHGGPPDQTSPVNLACLCRRHHRAKTFAGWRYRRLPDDESSSATYEWTSPHLRTYRVTTTTR